MRKLFFVFLAAFHVSHLTFDVIAQTPTQQWTARYVRPSGSSAIANQMALDKVGNCYVLGNKPVLSGVGGILLIKYNASGDTVWTRTYNIGAGNAAVNVGVLADSIGNVYITGYFGPTFGPYDIVLIKYNASGIQEWIRLYSGAGNVSDTPGGLALDKYNRPFLAGRSGNEALIIKYNTNGDTLWVRKFNIAGYSSGAGWIDINPQSFVYVGGSTRLISTNQNHYLAIKYDSNGVFQWYDKYTGSGFESPRKMVIDIFDNCFITGEGNDGITEGGLTIKYASNGTRLWLRVFRYGEATDANDMVTDVNGNAYVTGAYSRGAGNFDYVTVKYNPAGDTSWVRTYNGTANDNDEAYSIDIDDSSNVYVTGRSIGLLNSFNYVTIKYHANGNQQWLVAYNNNPPGNAEDIAYAVKVDKSRNVYVTGVSDRGGLMYDYATVKYNQPLGITPISNSSSKEYKLSQNFPNPFNPATVIKFALPESEKVRLSIYDITGKVVNQLVNAYLTKGEYEVQFSANGLASGVYFYNLITDNFNQTRSMILIK